MPCSVLGEAGQVLYEDPRCADLCSRCAKMGFCTSECGCLRKKAADEASRFGGRYICTCPIGMGWISVPLNLKGKAASSLSAGPVMVMSHEEQLATLRLLDSGWGEQSEKDLEEFLSGFPVLTTSRLSAVSEQLLASAARIRESCAVEQLRTESLDPGVSDRIRQLRGSKESRQYPIDLEYSLGVAVMQGSREDANRIMNDLLGHLLFTAGSDAEYMQARVSDILTIMSRSAIQGGSETDSVLQISQDFRKTCLNIHSVIDLGIFLSKAMKQYVAMVYEISSLKHKRSIYRVISYVRNRLSEKISLEEVARHVGFSQSYLSRVFRAEMGMNFNTFLQKERIELAKILLLRNDLTTLDVCAQAGFEDQSYFIKVFRRHEGMTPGEFRHGRGRAAAENAALLPNKNNDQKRRHSIGAGKDSL